jgi:CBS domain-containing protein
MRINEVLASKASKEIITVGPDATVRELLGLLAVHNIGALIVSSDGASVEGIVSERDVVRRLHENEDVLSFPVSAIMTNKVHTCEGQNPVSDVVKMMTERRFRHVPVVEDARLVGIISIGDVVKARMSELQFERDQLDTYVQSAQT